MGVCATLVVEGSVGGGGSVVGGVVTGAVVVVVVVLVVVVTAADRVEKGALDHRSIQAVWREDAGSAWTPRLPVVPCAGDTRQAAPTPKSP